MPGVTGVYNPGNHHIPKWERGLDYRFDWKMSDLRAYLLVRLLWNPDLDWRAERCEFCAAYYGEAAGPIIEQYLDDAPDVFDKQNVSTTIDGFGVGGFRWITPQMFERWYAYMDKAESLAEDDQHKLHVRITRLPIYFTHASIEQDEAKRKTLMPAYLDTARELGLDQTQMVRESYDLKTWAAAQRVGMEIAAGVFGQSQMTKVRCRRRFLAQYASEEKEAKRKEATSIEETTIHEHDK